jgi:formylglycine-generating enzyme required for sulfatase activity
MVLIPSGSFTMGPSNPNAALDQNPTLKTVSIKAFYMDETEITNSEYRQFVNWVRDSLVRYELAVRSYTLNKDNLDEDGKPKADNDETKLADFYPLYTKKVDDNNNNDNISVYERYKSSLGNNVDISNKSTWKIDWSTGLTYDRDNYPDIEYAKTLEGDPNWNVNVGINTPEADLKDPDIIYEDGFFIPAEETANELRAIRTKRLKYSYREFDKDNAKWSDYKRIEVYPDTTVWFNDFGYSYNEPMHYNYFWHDAYADYPVVGVSWEQAKAFAHWRTFYKNQHQRKQRKNVQLVSDYRLPTEAEWEYAARGGLERAEYPWGGPYTYDDKGCFLANFKPERGDYAADQILYTAEAESYWPNDYGLYNMAGNVSEWTDSNYEKSANDFVSGLNPNVEGDDINNKKVVRGGSWKDTAHFLKVSTRDFEYQNKKRSYIGFRTVQSYLGEDVGFQENPNKIF